MRKCSFNELLNPGSNFPKSVTSTADLRESVKDIARGLEKVVEVAVRTESLKRPRRDPGTEKEIVSEIARGGVVAPGIVTARRISETGIATGELPGVATFL